MYDTKLSSITCSGLEFLTSAVDFDDLAFMNLILCMQEADSALAAKMKEIRELNDLKRMLTDEINYLNKALARSHAKADGKHQDDLVYVHGGLESPKDPDESPFKTADEQRKFEKEWQGYRDKGRIVRWEYRRIFDMDVRVPIKEKATEQELRENHLYKRSEVEARIEELRGRLEDLNTSSSVLMIDLQRLMNKRNEAVQLTSNIEAKSHQTAIGIIANFK